MDTATDEIINAGPAKSLAEKFDAYNMISGDDKKVKEISIAINIE